MLSDTHPVTESHQGVFLSVRYSRFRRVIDVFPQIIKSPRSGVTLCFQFVSAASAAASTTFVSHV